MSVSCKVCGQMFLPLEGGGDEVCNDHMLTHHLDQFLSQHTPDYADA